MGLLLCEICNEHLSFTSEEIHVCDREKIKARIAWLENQARTAERKLDDVQNAVFMILDTLPTYPENSEVVIKTENLQRLWDAAKCQWRGANNAESFFHRWFATHRVLTEAYNLFRTKKYNVEKSLLEKLVLLKEAIDDSKVVLGYESSRLDLTPEDVVKQCQ